MKALVLFCLLSASIPAFAQTASDVAVPGANATAQSERRAVAHLLSAIHELPPRAEFERAAANPWTILASLAASRGPIAERAVEAMFYWPTDATFEWATRQLADAANSRARRHRLLLQLADAYADRATPVVVPFLTDADPQLRITAAAAIAKIRSETAFAALDAAVVAERNEAVARELQRYARRILP